MLSAIIYYRLTTIDYRLPTTDYWLATIYCHLLSTNYNMLSVYTYSWHDAHPYAHAHAHAQKMTQKRTQGTRRIPQIRNSGNMLIRILIFWVLWIFLPINFLAPGGWVVPRMRLHDLPAFCGCLSIGAGSVLVRALEFVTDGSSRLPHKRLGMWITGCLHIFG